MDIPPDVKKEVSTVTHVFWHEDCVENPKIDLTDDQRKFYRTQGRGF